MGGGERIFIPLIHIRVPYHSRLGFAFLASSSHHTAKKGWGHTNRQPNPIIIISSLSMSGCVCVCLPSFSPSSWDQNKTRKEAKHTRSSKGITSLTWEKISVNQNSNYRYDKNLWWEGVLWWWWWYLVSVILWLAECGPDPLGVWDWFVMDHTAFSIITTNPIKSPWARLLLFLTPSSSSLNHHIFFHGGVPQITHPHTNTQSVWRARMMKEMWSGWGRAWVGAAASFDNVGSLCVPVCVSEMSASLALIRLPLI